jgi:hypothetical protein
MIPEVHACSGYLVITAPNGAYRDNAGALPHPCGIYGAARPGRMRDSTALGSDPW